MLPISELGIVADDLTGACNVAACFTPASGHVAVFVSPDGSSQESYGLSVINTASRLMMPHDARTVLRTIGGQLRDRRVIFKKVDTALRGPVGAEIEGLLESSGQRQVVIAPAIPGIDRTTKEGLQYDRGTPIDQTDYANDPASPVTTANIADAIRATASGHLDFTVEDAETHEDLRRIVVDSLQAEKVLLVGSLGLADALAERLAPTETRRAQVRKSMRPLIVCGSLYGRSRKQVESAARHYGVEVITFEPERSRGPRIQGMPAIVCLPETPPDSLDMFRLSVKSLSNLIRSARPDGIGVIGGETAFHLLRELEATRLDIHGQMAEVIAFGSVADGFLAGCPMAVKGGSVGPGDAVIRMIEYLREGKE